MTPYLVNHRNSCVISVSSQTFMTSDYPPPPVLAPLGNTFCIIINRRILKSSFGVGADLLCTA